MIIHEATIITKYSISNLFFFWKRSSLLFLLFALLLSNSALGQTAVQNKRIDTQKNSQSRQLNSPQQQSQNRSINPRVGRQKAKPSFFVQMRSAANEFKWCQTYFKSFRKTNEVDYLKLSGKYCKSAVQIYYQTQNDQSKKTKFYYQAQEGKLKVCDYYQTIRNHSLQRRKSEQLSPFSPSYCSD